MEAKLEKIWGVVTEFALSTGVRLVGAILILILGFWFVDLITKKTTKAKGLKKVDPGARSFLRSFISTALKIVVLLTALAVLGVPMTSVVALLGTAGLAVGLALQGSLTNLCGGLMILLFRPFRVGDFIKSGEIMGTVREISVLYTTVITIDNCRVVAPNGSLSNAVVTDYSAEPTRRVDMEFSVAYSSDLDKVKAILSDILEGHELILQDPAPVVYVKAHGESAIVFVTRAWVNAGDYWTVYFDLNELVKKRFDESGVEIPFPQVDVHMR